MKKILSVLLALVMLFTFALSAMAETAEDVTDKKAEEMETVMAWLSEQISEDEAEQILSWDKETILAKLEDYDQPLEYTTKEEIADELMGVLGLFGIFANMTEEASENGENIDVSIDLNGENGEESFDLSSLLGSIAVSDNGEESFDLSALLGGLTSDENGEESLDLSALLGGLLSGEDGDVDVKVDLSDLLKGLTTDENGESLDLSALLSGLTNGEESFDLSGLLKGFVSDENGEVNVDLDLSDLLKALSTDENGEGLNLSGLLGSLTSGENGEEGMDLSALFALFGGFAMDGTYEGSDDYTDESYEINGIFDGTFWESGDLKLESVFQDGYYKVAITKGDKELSYLCEYNELQEGDTYYARLISIGTGVEEFDAEQEDHGIATFTMNDEGQLVWTKADGTEVAFTEIVDPLTICQWYVDGKMLHIDWLGDLNYTVTIEDWMEGNTWTYNCVLDEATDVLTGTGIKTQYGDEVYTDANATFTFTDARVLLTWQDDKAEETADGITFEMVQDAFTCYWQADGVDDYIAHFADGYYHITITVGGTPYSYICTYDRGTSTLTAVDPATLDPEELSEPENYRSTATFELLDDDDMLWKDDSGITGEDGIVLQLAK